MRIQLSMLLHLFPSLQSNTCATIVFQPLLTILFITTARSGSASTAPAVHHYLTSSQQGLFYIFMKTPPTYVALLT